MSDGWKALGLRAVPLEHLKGAGKGQDWDRWSNGDWQQGSLALCQAVEWGGQITARS